MAGDTAVAAPAAVRWGIGPHVFELSSPLPEVIDRAATVFRPWAAQFASGPTRQWSITPDRDNPGGWTLSVDGATQGATSPSANAAVRRVEYLAVQTIFDGPPDLVTIHAALVARGGRGMLIAGVPETGKSTLACALWQRGFTLFSDDVAIVDLEQRTAAPAPRRVSLREPSRELLGEALWARIARAPSSEPTDEGLVFHPSEIDGSVPAVVPIAAVVFLGRTTPDEQRDLARPLPPAHAALAALPFLNVARRMDVGALLPRLTPFVMGVTACDLLRADLPAMCTAVERILEQAS